MANSPFPVLGLRTVIYPAPDLDATKGWWTKLLGQEPYFDQPYYVGFNLGGYELGLDPNANPDEGPLTYWGVANIDAAVSHALLSGAAEHTPVRDVGDGIRVATLRTPTGHILGLIHNPNFVAEDSTAERA
jgi:catechol 2,3-dioxygenase-like lactoylglutathione lyase family enzyme